MKIVTGKTGLILRLGLTAIVLLLGQQAMAVGTDAGTSIDNTVNVDYEVAGINQDDLTDTVSFVVDRRVSFTLTQLGGQLVEVTPGETLAFFDLLLTNTSNSTLDFSLDLDASIVTVRGFGVTASMDNIIYAVSTEVYTAGTEADPATTGPDFVDELAEDDAIRIRVWGDAAISLLNDDIDGIQITATASQPGTGDPLAAGPTLTEVADTADGVENVFAGTNNDGIEFESDGFLVQTAELAVTKSYLWVSDSLSSGLAIPGAIIEYTILVVNSSDTAADNVVITDSIDTNVDLVLNAYGGGNDISVVNNITTLACDIETNGDGDGCDSTLPDFTVGAGDLPGGITVAGLTTLTIRYQVTIP